MRDFRNYEIWKKGHQLTLEVYKHTAVFPAEEKFGITSQFRRAASSIPINISEGCGRETDKEFNLFLNYSLGSVSETEYLLILSRDLNFIDEVAFQQLNNSLSILKRQIHTLKQKLK